MKLTRILPVLLMTVGVTACAQEKTSAPAATASVATNPKSIEGLFQGKRVLWLGDSITQDGTYVSYLEYLLEKRNPAFRTDLVSAGLGSETTSGLSEPGHAGGAFARPCVHERLERALAAFKPEVVVACYGMNDGIYQPYDDKRMAAFKAGVTKLVAACTKAGAKVVLVTPPVYEGGADYEKVLKKFAAWEVSNKPSGVVAVADLHSAMSAELETRMKKDPKFRFTTDKIHPGETGHAFMALAILKGLGVTIPDTTPEALIESAKQDPLWPLVSSRRKLRSVAWLNHIGYSREKKVAPGTGDIKVAEKSAADLQAKADALRCAAK